MVRTWLCAVWLLGCWLPALAGSSPSPTPLAPATRAATASAPADADRYQKLVADLADPRMEGRASGSAGHDRARDYLIRQLRELGLQPGVGEAWLQPFPLRLGLELRRIELSVRDAKGKVLLQAARAQLRGVTYSTSGRFDGPAVWVGYGVADAARGYDSYKGLPADGLAGKVAVCFRYEPQKDGRSRWGQSWTSAAGILAKARLARAHGASALIVVNPPSHAQADPVGLAAAGISADLPILQAGPELLAEMLRRTGREDAGAAAAMQAAADESGGAPQAWPIRLAGRVELADVMGTGQNVAGVLSGRGELARQVVIVGAHYDHVGTSRRGQVDVLYPGADDNASGAAGVLTLARWLAARANADDAAGAKAGAASRRTVLFAFFDAEERGLLGSQHMAEHLGELRLAPGRVAAMLNLDMIGRLRQRRLAAWGADSGDLWRSWLDEAARQQRLEVHMSGPVVRFGDHASFYAVKVPVLGLHTGVHDDYHSPNDTPDRIDAAGAIEVCRLAERILWQLASEPRAVAYQAVKTGVPELGQKGGAYLGVSPDPSSEGGCRLAEVLEGGPARKAGLRPADLIVELDGKKVEAVLDVLEALKAAKPGQKVHLTVRRGEETVELEAVLGTHP